METLLGFVPESEVLLGCISIQACTLHIMICVWRSFFALGQASNRISHRSMAFLFKRGKTADQQVSLALGALDALLAAETTPEQREKVRRSELQAFSE